MSGNSKMKGARVSHASRQKQMEAFDRLPPSVRSALANAAFDYAAYPIHRKFEAGYYRVKALVALIAAWDRRQIKKGAP